MKNECLDAECVTRFLGRLTERLDGLNALGCDNGMKSAAVLIDGYHLELLEKASSAILNGDRATAIAISKEAGFADRPMLRHLIYAALVNSDRSLRRVTPEDEAKAIFANDFASLFPDAEMVGPERLIPGTSSKSRVDFLLSRAGRNIPVEVKGAARLRDVFQLQEYIDLADAPFGYLVAVSFDDKVLQRVRMSRGKYVAIYADVESNSLSLVGAP